MGGQQHHRASIKRATERARRAREGEGEGEVKERGRERERERESASEHRRLSVGVGFGSESEGGGDAVQTLSAWTSAWLACLLAVRSGARAGRGRRGKRRSRKGEGGGRGVDGEGEGEEDEARGVGGERSGAGRRVSERRGLRVGLEVGCAGQREAKASARQDASSREGAWCEEVRFVCEGAGGTGREGGRNGRDEVWISTGRSKCRDRGQRRMLKWATR